MKTFCAFLFLLLVPFILFGQDKKDDETSIKLYGFIRNSVYTDTYRGVDAVHDLFYLLPLYGGVDANGDDINQSFQSNMTAVATRLGTKISGPELFGAKSSANIEFDFGGITGAEPTLFRIRKAYMQLNWEESMLIVGQTWHPFWGDASFPHVGALNTGAPFQVFNRSPQVRYDYKVSDNITLLGAAVYENQYTSKGLMNPTNGIQKTRPQRYSGLPEIVAIAKYKKDNITLGVGAEYKTILPIDVVNNIKTSTTNTSVGFTAYGNYKKDKLYVLLKGTYGQNLTHLTMPGGYGVKSVDATTGAYNYTNYNNYATFLNITYGKKWQGGLMLGYGSNLGTSDKLHEFVDPITLQTSVITQGLFQSIQSMYRIAPSITLNVKNFHITAEYEMTSADYGTGAINYSDGLYNNTHTATNHRTMLMMMYMF